MFHFIKLGKKLEFENKRFFFFFFLNCNVVLYKVRKKVRIWKEEGKNDFSMCYFIKLGKKLEFENKRFFFNI